MDRLRIGRAMAIGWSLGAKVALALAATQPSRVERLVLIDPPVETPPQAAKPLRAYWQRLDRTYPSMEAFFEQMRGSPVLGRWTPYVERFLAADAVEDKHGCVRGDRHPRLPRPGDHGDEPLHDPARAASRGDRGDPAVPRRSEERLDRGVDVRDILRTETEALDPDLGPDAVLFAEVARTTVESGRSLTRSILTTARLSHYQLRLQHEASGFLRLASFQPVEEEHGGLAA